MKSAAHVADEAADQDDDVDHQRQRDPGHDHGRRKPGDAARQRRRQAGVTLAGDRRVGFAAEPALLHPEGAERETEQHDGEHRRLPLIVGRADDRKEDLGRQHLEIAAEHQRIAEIGHALDEAEQEGIGDAGLEQRPGHGAEGLPALGAERLRSLFEARRMPCTTPIRTRKAIGAKARTCASRTPGRP